MDDDDDFYGATESTAAQNENTQRQPPSEGRPHEGDGVNMDDDAEEEEEDEDDDDDFNIITEAPTDAAPADISHPRHATLRNESQRPPSRDSTAAAGAKSITPSATPRGNISTPVTAAAKPAVAPQKPGSAYPPVHVSTIDVNANPTLPATGKPILSTDMDADFPSEDDKPWRRPGSDVTDYFNYGFDEFTWASYCIKQQELRKEVGDQKKQLEDMQAFLTMGMPPMPGAPQPGPGGPPPTAAPPGMPGMPGMPDMSPDMMQGMLASMMAQGLDPSAMDPMSFMQHAQAMMGGQPGGGAGPPPGQAGYGGQPQGQGFGGQVPGQGHMGYGGGYDQRSGYGVGGGGGGRGRGQRRW